MVKKDKAAHRHRSSKLISKQIHKRDIKIYMDVSPETGGSLGG